MRTFLAGAFVLLFSLLTYSVSTPTHALTHYENYLGRYCGSVTPPSSCGGYQMLVNLANLKVNDFTNSLSTYSTSEQHQLITEVQNSMNNIINNYPDGETKFLAVYYHVRLSQYLHGSRGSTNVLGYFFDNFSTTNTYTNTSYSNTNYTFYNNEYEEYADGEIDNVWSTSRYTVVDNRSKDITIRNNDLEVGIRALGWDGGAATKSVGYQVVAVLDSSSSRYDDRVYNANYNSSSKYWSVDANIGSYSPRRMTFYLLHENGDGTRFNKAGTYRNRYVLDSVTYDIERDRNYNDYYYRYDDRYYDDYYDDDCDDRYYYCDDYYDDDRSDLGIRSVRYEWEYDRDEVVVELTTIVRNYGRYDTRLNDLEYSVEADNRTIRSSQYDIDVVDVDCDNYTSRTRATLIDIDRGDECEIVVELTFDEDDVDNEYLEIEVELDAHGDNNRDNDSRIVRFRVRD